MKKYILSLALMACAISMTAQDQESNYMPKREEIKLNLALTTLAWTPTISYEHLLSKEISMGASLGYDLNYGGDSPGTIQAIPFARWFIFGNKKTPQRAGAGFFIETNMAFFADSYFKNSRAGIGLAVGFKYVTPSNWVAEFHGGGGRFFTESDNYSLGYGRIGISIGKRF